MVKVCETPSERFQVRIGSFVKLLYMATRLSRYEGGFENITTVWRWVRISGKITKKGPDFETFKFIKKTLTHVSKQQKWIVIQLNEWDSTNQMALFRRSLIAEIWVIFYEIWRKLFKNIVFNLQDYQVGSRSVIFVPKNFCYFGNSFFVLLGRTVQGPTALI